MKQTTKENCQICTSPLLVGVEEWHFVCRRCGYEKAAFSPSINDEVLHSKIDEQARESGLKSLRQSNFKRLVDVLQTVHPKAETLLDVGCAHGWFVEAASRSFNVLGIEPDQAVYASTSSRGLPVRLGFFPDALEADERFDIIVFNDVFEHIPDSEAILRACHEKLNENGVLLLNLPSSSGFFYKLSKLFHRIGLSSFFDRLWQKGMPSPHLHYFNTKNLSDFLGDNGFETVKDGSLPTLQLAGLYTRISCSGDMNFLKSLAICACVAVALPIIRIFPSDIVYVVARKKSRF